VGLFLRAAWASVAEGFIGMDGRGKRVEIRTGMGGGDCGYSFERGRSYVVYAYQDKDGLVASLCTRTAPLERAQADLAYLRKLPDSGPDTPSVLPARAIVPAGSTRRSASGCRPELPERPSLSPDRVRMSIW
jgi:hypothetical protein